jgi:CO/xanthine dehydrogenase FAD-binding subunit
MVTAILVPAASSLARSTFLKLGARRYLVISIAMVAVMIDVAESGVIRRCGIAVGACSAVAQRLTALEFLLVGQPASPALANALEPAHLEGLAPIDDVRGTAWYRRDAAATLVRRALRELLDE